MLWGFRCSGRAGLMPASSCDQGPRIRSPPSSTVPEGCCPGGGCGSGFAGGSAPQGFFLSIPANSGHWPLTPPSFRPSGSSRGQFLSGRWAASFTKSRDTKPAVCLPIHLSHCESMKGALLLAVTGELVFWLHRTFHRDTTFSKRYSSSQQFLCNRTGS